MDISFIRPDFYEELTSVRCDYSRKYITCVLFVILSDTTDNICGTFCHFSLFAASIFLAMQMKLREGAWGKDAPSFGGERRHQGASLTFQFPNTEQASFPNCQLLLKSNFSYSKHYRHWKCINIIQTLCPSQDRHYSKPGNNSSGSRQHLSAHHEARHPMLLAGLLALSPE